MPSTILDQSTDITRDLLPEAITRVPEFVKAAANSAAALGDPESLPSHIYAMPRLRLFPCHTKIATCMSAAYFALQKPAIGEDAAAVSDFIVKQARFFNVGQAVSDMLQPTETRQVKAASTSDEDYALVIENNGKIERLLPLSTHEQVKAAVAWFNDGWRELDFETRSGVARKIQSKLEEGSHGLLTEGIEKSAGLGTCSTDEIVRAWSIRADLTNKAYPEHAKLAKQLAAATAEQGIAISDRSTRLKIASVMDEFDRETGLSRKYDDETGIQSPEEHLFGVTIKAAEDFLNNHVMLPNGSVYKLASLRAVPVETVRDWCGYELSVKCGGMLSTAADLAPHVPDFSDEETRLFDSMLKAAGEQPVAKSNPRPVTISDDELQRLAAVYTNSR